MGLLYDTASAQVIQVVNLNVSPGIIPTEIDKNLKSTTPTTEVICYLDRKLIVKVLSRKIKILDY